VLSCTRSLVSVRFLYLCCFSFSVCGLKTSKWSYILLLAVVCGVIDYFAAGMSSVELPESWFSWLFKLFGVDVVVVAVFRLILALLAFLVCWRFSPLVGGVAFIFVLCGVPFVDSFFGVMLAGLLVSWYRFEGR